MRIQTADDTSIQPANFGSLDVIAAPISPILEKSAAWTPDNVYSLDVDVTMTKNAATSPRIPPITPIIKGFFIYSFVGGYNLKWLS